MQRRKRKKGKNLVTVLIFGLLVEMHFLAAPVSGQESTVENPLLSPVRLQVSGYTHILYSWWEEGVDSFLVKRARLSLSGEILRKMKFKLQADAVKSPVLVDAQVDLEFSLALGLRIGQFYVPFSLENRTSSSMLDTILRSQVVDKLAPSRDIGSPGRDIGAMLCGKYSFVEYMAGFFNGSGVNKADTNAHKDFSVRVVLRPAAFISIGGSLYNGRHSPAQGDNPFTRDRMGIDVSLDSGAFSGRAEYISGQDNQTRKAGWYIQGGYFISTKKIQAVCRLDSYDPDKDAVSDRNDILTFGLNWYFSEKTKLQVNYNSYRKEGSGVSNSALLVQFQAGF